MRTWEAREPVVWMTCAACGLDEPARPSHSPGVPRETRCQACLVAEIARLQRLVHKFQAARAGIG